MKKRIQNKIKVNCCTLITLSCIFTIKLFCKISLLNYYKINQTNKTFFHIFHNLITCLSMKLHGSVRKLYNACSKFQPKLNHRLISPSKKTLGSNKRRNGSFFESKINTFVKVFSESVPDDRH